MNTRPLQGLVLLAGTLLGPHAHAECPAPPPRLTVIVPFAVGGATDVSARFFSKEISQRYKVSAVVENVSGASGRIGVNRVRNGGDDLVAINTPSSAIINWIFDGLTDAQIAGMQQHVYRIALGPQLLVIRSPLANARTAGSWKDALRSAKSFGSSGLTSHIGVQAQYLSDIAGAGLTHVPYRGTGESMAALLGGHIDVSVMSAAAARSHVKAGELVALMTSSDRRLPELPDVPTAKEAGGTLLDSWFILSVKPGNTRLATWLACAAAEAFASDEARESLGREGLVPGALAGEALQKTLREELGVWRTMTRGQLGK